MISKTFYDDNPEDRRYVHDYWSWLQTQPQDAWLLWARCANWDNADAIFASMVERFDCDLALVSWIFWGCQPDYYVRNPGHYGRDSLIGKIVGNVERGAYRSSALFYDRYEVAIYAHEYRKALGEVPAGTAPFRLPRELCGPFDGRRASIPAAYDAQTERDLEEIFDSMDGGLPRSEDEHWRTQVAGGNLWLKDRLKLPTVRPDAIAAYRHLDDPSYVEAIFGSSSSYAAARSPRKRWWSN
jgi:hypothetical protein